jgi:hypothetical protein
MLPVRHLIDRLAAAEDRFRSSEFLAPAVGSALVAVRVAGVVCRFVAPRGYRGWGVFRPAGRRAKLVRDATLAERQRYLDLFPRRPMILVRPDGRDWVGWPAHQADARFGRPAPVPVRLVEDAQPFDRVEARFDGAQAWFDRPDERGDASSADYLRHALRAMTPPDAVDRPRLTAEERSAYRLAWEARREALRDRTEDRLRDALGHAGAELRGYVERADGYRVDFAVAGKRHVSVVDKADLTVQLAGVCLDGADRHFDLASLVGVLREANDVLRIGDGGMAEEMYWEVHPPR